MYDLDTFIDEIAGYSAGVKIRFVGLDQNYVEAFYPFVPPYDPTIISCGFSSGFCRVFINDSDELLIDNKRMNLNETEQFFREFYGYDYIHVDDNDFNSFRRLDVDLVSQHRIVKRLKKDTITNKENSFFRYHLEKQIRILEIVKEFGDYRAVLRRNAFEIKVWECTSVKIYFSILSNITKAMIGLRNRYTLENWGKYYKQCLENKNKMFFLEEILPNCIRIKSQKSDIEILSLAAPSIEYD